MAELTLGEKVCELVRLTERLAPDNTVDGARLLLMAAAAGQGQVPRGRARGLGVMVGNSEDHG